MLLAGIQWMPNTSIPVTSEVRRSVDELDERSGMTVCEIHIELFLPIRYEKQDGRMAALQITFNPLPT